MGTLMYQGESTCLQEGDTIIYDTLLQTISFRRKNEDLREKKDGDHKFILHLAKTRSPEFEFYNLVKVLAIAAGIEYRKITKRAEGDLIFLTMEPRVSPN